MWVDEVSVDGLPWANRTVGRLDPGDSRNVQMSLSVKQDIDRVKTSLVPCPPRTLSLGSRLHPNLIRRIDNIHRREENKSVLQ